MKTSLATALSVAGVIAAGAAAYAVNTSVLGASADPAPLAIESTTTVPISNSAPSANKTVSGAATTPADNAAITPEANAVNDSTTTYKVGNAGSVVIDTSSGQVVVTSILPAAGFTS